MNKTVEVEGRVRQVKDNLEEMSQRMLDLAGRLDAYSGVALDEEENGLIRMAMLPQIKAVMDELRCMYVAGAPVEGGLDHLMGLLSLGQGLHKR